MFFDEEYEPYWAVGCYDDITADKEMWERYKQLKVYRQIFTSDAVLAYEVDLDADIILAFDKKSLDTNMDVGSSFSAFVQAVADKFVHPDFQGGFSQVFNRDNLMAVFRNGKKEVVYDFISNENDIEYRWLRETVRLVRHSETGHTCAFLCVKNIDKEKNEEIRSANLVIK